MSAAVTCRGEAFKEKPPLLPWSALLTVDLRKLYWKSHFFGEVKKLIFK